MAFDPPAYVPHEVEAEAPPKKKRPIFLWVFLAVQVAFAAWIAWVLLTSNIPDCGPVNTGTTCDWGKAGAEAGRAVTVFIVVGAWLVVDFLLAVSYGIYRLATRP